MSSRRDFMKAGALLAAGAFTGIGREALAAAPVSRKGAPVIKVGCAAHSYAKYLRANEMTLEQFIDQAAEMGCDGVELTSYYWPQGFDRAYLNKIKRQAFLLGLDICASSVGNSFTVPAGDARNKSIELTKTWITHCAEMGAPVLRVFGGSVGKGVVREDAFRWAVECFQIVAPFAEQNGVMLGIENHGGMPATADEVIRMLDAIKSNWVGANLDTGNYHTDDPYADIAKTAPHAVTTHFKTEVAWAGKPKVPADLKKIIGILRKSNYRGYLTLEYESSEEPRIAVPNAIMAMKKAVEE